MSEYLIKLTNRDNSIVKDDHEETVQTGSNAKIDYRFVGANPNNYVCLEADGNCDENELYRIIGVIPTQKEDEGEYKDRVKLVKYTSYGNYPICGSDASASCNYEESTLSLETLNNKYWNEISSYQKYIEEAKWYLGKAVWGNTVKGTYKAERSNTGGVGSSNIFMVANVGLIYFTDYGYATSGQDEQSRVACIEKPKNTEIAGDYSYCNQNNWLYENFHQWIIDPDGNNIHMSLNKEFTTNSGGLNNSSKNASLAVKPAFYLSSKVQYASGNGTKENPYRIMINE